AFGNVLAFETCLYVSDIDAVTSSFAVRRLMPAPVFSAIHRRESDGCGAESHHDRAANHQGVNRSAATAQLAKDEDAPEKAPELIGIRKGNSPANPHVLRGVLLEQVADHPHKSSE